MADDGFSYDTSIKDGMSGPAHDEVNALKSLQSQIRETEKAISDLQKEQLNYKRAGFKDTAKDIGIEIQKLKLPLGDMKRELRDVKDEARAGEDVEKGFFKEFGGSLVPSIALGELAAEGVKGIGEAFVEVAEGIADTAFEATKFAVEMSEFRENTVDAYEAVLGTKDAGEAAFEQIENVGKGAHIPVERAAGLAQELMLQGETNMSTIQSTVQAVANLSRVGLEDGASKIQRLISTSLATGKLFIEKRSLQGTGVQLDALTADLATRLHQSVGQIKEELKKGSIGAEVGIQAITDEINNGKIGEVAAKKLTLKDIGTDLKNDFAELFEGVNVSPLIQGLDTLKMLFEDAGGDVTDLKTQVTDTFNEVIKWVGDAADDVTELGLHFEIGFLRGEIAAKPMIAEIKKFIGTKGDLTDIGNAAETMGEGFVKTASSVAYLSVELLKLRNLTNKDTLHVGGVELGNGLIEGFVDAMTHGAYGPIKVAAQLVGKEALAAVKGILGIHSPSTEMMTVGLNVQEGFVQGMQRGQSRTDDAMGAAMPAPDALALPDFSGFHGGGGTTIHVDTVHAEVHAPGGAAVTAHELQELSEHAVYDALERIATELGG